MIRIAENCHRSTLQSKFRILLTCGPRRFGLSSYWLEILLGKAWAACTIAVFDNTPIPIKKSRRCRSVSSFEGSLRPGRSHISLLLNSVLCGFCSLGAKLKAASRVRVTTINHDRSIGILKMYCGCGAFVETS
jgi:hypothetical protein